MRICTINKIKRIFERDNVCVTGLRGRGKDMLTANVIVRRKKPYISNICYDSNGLHIPLNFDDIDCGKNTYDNFITGKVNGYVFPYERGTDVYISDAGIYLPAQYCNELNKKYPYIATYQAISRHVSGNSFHVNCQNLNRMYDKIREMSDTYITCNKCIYLCGFVIQVITIYDKYQSCVDRVKPCRIRVPLLNAQAKMQARTYIDNFENVHGSVKRYLLIYRNKSNYDTTIFDKILKGGVSPEA